jgi:hypothetical protein
VIQAHDTAGLSDTGTVLDRREMMRADEVLHRFFREQAAGLTPRRAYRMQRAEADLRACLEHLAPLLFTDQERALLALERQFEAADAEARVASAEAVLLVLPVFLDEPRWHGTDLEDRRLRIRVARALSEEILRSSLQRGVDVGRAAGVVDAAVRHEIWMLRQESAASRDR